MKGAKTPCMPSLVPVVQLAQPGKLFGRIVERSGALAPSRIKRDKSGKRPASASGRMMSKVAPSSPMITVFIQRFRKQNSRHNLSRFFSPSSRSIKIAIEWSIMRIRLDTDSVQECLATAVRHRQLSSDSAATQEEYWCPASTLAIPPIQGFMLQINRRIFFAHLLQSASPSFTYIHN